MDVIKEQDVIPSIDQVVTYLAQSGRFFAIYVFI